MIFNECHKIILRRENEEYTVVNLGQSISFNWDGCGDDVDNDSGGGGGGQGGGGGGDDSGVDVVKI